LVRDGSEGDYPADLVVSDLREIISSGLSFQ